ncbi:MAG TPA: hypothetical protein VMT86_20050 [Bryobacteraceae bacterium]|nr:hypothetical protein [Bryobacteraceae bacterium]
MRVAIAVSITVLFMEAGLPIYGQNKAAKTGDQTQATQNRPRDTPPSTPIASGPSDPNQPTASSEKHRQTDQPNSYFDALVSANNLPNVILAVIGFVGVVIGIRTLGWLKRQTTHIAAQSDHMRSQVERMDQQRIDSNQSSADNLVALNRQVTALENQVVAMKEQARDGRQANTDTLAAIQRQVTVMGEQTITMRTQCAAMERQVDAIIAGGRAWVVVNRVGGPETSQHRWYMPELPQYMPGMAFEFKVLGNTPVIIRDARFNLLPVPVKDGTNPTQPDLPVVPDYTGRARSPEIPDNGRVIAPGATFQIMVGLPNTLTPQEWESMRDFQTLMCAHGFIQYEDAFNRKRETAVCYIYRLQAGGVITATDGTVLNPDRFEIGGPAEYNRTT